MLDRLNRELTENDKVTYTRGTKSELYLGTVKRFTKMNVIIIPDRRESWKDEVTMKPSQLLIINEVCTTSINAQREFEARER